MKRLEPVAKPGCIRVRMEKVAFISHQGSAASETPAASAGRLKVLKLALVAAGIVLTIAYGANPASAQTPAAPAVEALLVQGRLADARRQLEEQLSVQPEDDNARFALGVTQTLQAVEQLMQSLYRYGLKPNWSMMLPFVRLPVPENPAAVPLTNSAFRQMIADFAVDLQRAEATLAAVDSQQVKLPLHLALFRLDFDGDGEATQEETLWKVFNRIVQAGRRGEVDQPTAEQFVIAFDKADVYWLRGYCHVLQAICDVHLAYDSSKLHDHTAHIFFPSAEIPHKFLQENRGEMIGTFADLIAFIHLLKLPIQEPERMKSAREHCLEMIRLSRLSWSAIEAETDDDREWVPGPSQQSVAIAGARISGEMVAGWREILDELEAILEGQKLAPFWRGNGQQGVNVKRIFTEPREFDLVLWVQGSGAAPYLEEGPITDRAFWRRIQRAFRGQFFWFAIWVN